VDVRLIGSLLFSTMSLLFDSHFPVLLGLLLMDQAHFDPESDAVPVFSKTLGSLAS
jgi:hypothetical protein